MRATRISIVVGAELPCADEVGFGDAETRGKVDQIAGFEQFSAAPFLRRGFQLCRRVGGAAADEAGFAFRDEGGEFGYRIFRPAIAWLAMLPQPRQQPAGEFADLARAIGRQAFQEGHVIGSQAEMHECDERKPDLRRLG